MQQSNFKKFLLLWMGQLISAIGGGLTSFGLGVYVFEKTGSAAGMALVTLLGFLPTLVLSVPAGVLADRYDRRLLMMLGDGFSGLGVLFILLCMMRGETSLLQICLGVFISAVFSSLLDPAYKATVSDLLTEDEYSKASGLVSLAGSARYLVSPLIAGILLSVTDVKVLLVIDICTFMITVISTFAVRKGIDTQKTATQVSFQESLQEGWNAIRVKKGVFLLVMVSSVLTLFIGVFQILAEPLVLSMADAKTLGITETICASGMLVSSLYLGIRGIKKGYVKILSISLALAGVFILGFGVFESIVYITLSGFAFFLMLPFANNCLDYLVRTNTSVELQGRVWGIVGFLSQIGYVFAYGCSGILADWIAGMGGISVGRGAGIVMAFAGVALVIVSVSLLFMKEVKLLEKKSGEKIDDRAQFCQEGATDDSKVIME
ncbi:MAG: MFS transporter [Lachnospiraceae bacterium]|nr:MFS transporter [Lachnospiraceae bacterium]